MRYLLSLQLGMRQLLATLREYWPGGRGCWILPHSFLKLGSPAARIHTTKCQFQGSSHWVALLSTALLYLPPWSPAQLIPNSSIGMTEPLELMEYVSLKQAKAKAPQGLATALGSRGSPAQLVVALTWALVMQGKHTLAQLRAMVLPASCLLLLDWMNSRWFWQKFQSWQSTQMGGWRVEVRLKGTVQLVPGEQLGYPGEKYCRLRVLVLAMAANMQMEQAKKRMNPMARHRMVGLQASLSIGLFFKISSTNLLRWLSGIIKSISSFQSIPLYLLQLRHTANHNNHPSSFQSAQSAQSASGWVKQRVTAKHGIKVRWQSQWAGGNRLIAVNGQIETGINVMYMMQWSQGRPITSMSEICCIAISIV